MDVLINREELLCRIEKAKKRVRILGAVSFSLPYDRFKDLWYKKINEGTLSVEIICEAEPNLSYASLISSNKRVSGEDRSYDIGSFINLKNEPALKLREYLVKNGCKHIEPESDAIGDFITSQIEDDAKELKRVLQESGEYDEKTISDKLGKYKNSKRFELLESIESGKIDKNQFKQCFSLRTNYLNIPIPVINIDDSYYITQSLTKFCNQTKFELITKENIWFEEYYKYFHVHFDAPLGAKKFSTEITKKDNRTEVILMYNNQRHLLGQLPRDSFLGTTKVKVVVWGMLFTRDGRVLIHQRGKNAKDNQGLWDKSIGGHVDMEKDVVDTVKAAAREMLEELYKVEAAGQGAHTKIENMEPNADKPIFLGEWRPEIRYTLPFSEISSQKDEIFFFRMDYGFSKEVVDSPRLLPDGNEVPVRVFADVYAFVMPESFNTIDLKNSKYAILELHELSDAYQDGVLYFNGKEIEFKATPDLKKIITGRLWEQLNSFADYLKSPIL